MSCEVRRLPLCARARFRGAAWMGFGQAFLFARCRRDPGLELSPKNQIGQALPSDLFSAPQEQLGVLRCAFAAFEFSKVHSLRLR